jgi:hypothetical protein
MRPTLRVTNVACAHALMIFLGSTLLVAQAGWHKAGDHPADYEMGTDTTTAFTGNSSGFIKSKPNAQGFGTYMQTIDASEYRGKRVQLSAYVKSADIADWAGVWMRVDAGTTPIAFDNMQERPIKGSNDWTQHRLVLDVGNNASAIAFGILLSGKGSVWIDDVALEIVSVNVPVTDIFGTRKSGPSNLDFENPSKQ